jgi:hypothetical protein
LLITKFKLKANTKTLFMKSQLLVFGIAASLVGFTSCKNEEEERAERTVESYTRYVDSLEDVSEADARANWTSIEAEYRQRTTDAEAAMVNLKDRDKAERRLNESRQKYEVLRNRYQVTVQDQTTRNSGSGLQSSLFPTGTMGSDMNFDWVNKDNILRVYNDFYNVYQRDKDNYSREDFDEVKAMYEALDARKNTVEKEGLSATDNRKIAELKLKFAPKFKVDRMGAKTRENENAKDAAN